MDRLPKKVKDKDLQDLFNHIEQNALNVPIMADSAPTSADQVKIGGIVVYGTDLYIRVPDGTLLQISGTAV